MTPLTASRQPGLRPLTALARTLPFMLPQMHPKRARAPGPTGLRVVLLVQAVVVACTLWLCLAGVAAAQASDPPARVGHASLLGGQVEHSWDGNTWGPASVGAPLTTQSALRTAAQSRAEVRIGSTALRLSPDALIQFDQLDDAGVVVALHHGRLNVRLRQWAPAGDRLAVLLDGARFDAGSAGSFHLDVDGRGLRVAARVFAGSGTLTVGTQRVPITAGQQVLVDTQAMTVLKQGPAERRPLDDWADKRDQLAEARGERGGAALHAPAEMTGADLLDEHGAWRVDPRFGAVWFPRGVAADWAPYRQGRWTWVAPWGWTWIDDAPWGFAPFHYGRWMFLAGRWGWLPGSVQARPVYAPALVGFYGNPPGGWGGAAGAPPGGVVGWYPLGPGEFYRPAGNPSPAYAQALNLAQGAQAVAPRSASAAASHRYAQTSFAATVVPQAAFSGGQAVAASRLDVAPGTLAGAPALGSGAMPAGPAAAARPVAEAPRPAEARPLKALREQVKEARQARHAERAARKAPLGASPQRTAP
ncbi:hypothetical protein BurJ1DRAFT_4594 [Burkholderiales bacterium JOSHI_001]|nr:hypothetical protein BurJ1DRAFT_4594 [Burkholderiales bacterium JOSHI_001]